MPLIKNPKEYWLKKDFVIKQDSSSEENIKLRLLNRSTRELLYILVNKDSEGARSAQVEYFTANEEDYIKLVHSLIKLGYVSTTDNWHYEKRISTYETQTIVLRAMVSIKDKNYYAVNYFYSAGKELSEPVASPQQ